ncbi:TPA: hypothetical protein ACVBYD_004102 [Yersinia enterocolitica]|uniref:Uncharacterized protein n=1 Tax=Yersinia enterocolitica TaxID=630 RepID=B0RKZ5_YEREN|nr:MULTISPECIES: hypothetical protein [Yersinia]OWF71866.1 hypothetical protein B4903_22690 [Yersinia frederiksenii]AKF40328.1 hypothetical protein FORC2_p050 [Yersinia enterocolitica]ALG47333.1 hypothetical protein LI89_22200 [Yersinia enterocolitica]EKN3829034.1 hypothetical protein [Yersinia enterocolitica]EKN3882897.1 hypothetical protein [Yersinia enterocolitica]
MSTIPEPEHQKVRYLINHLNTKKPDYLKQNPRIMSFANIYMASMGGSAEIGTPHVRFFVDTHDYATRALDKVFFDEFGEHLAFSPTLRWNYKG